MSTAAACSGEPRRARGGEGRDQPCAARRRDWNENERGRSSYQRLAGTPPTTPRPPPKPPGLWPPPRAHPHVQRGTGACAVPRKGRVCVGGVCVTGEVRGREVAPDACAAQPRSSKLPRCRCPPARPCPRPCPPIVLRAVAAEEDLQRAAAQGGRRAGGWGQGEFISRCVQGGAGPWPGGSRAVDSWLFDHSLLITDHCEVRSRQGRSQLAAPPRPLQVARRRAPCTRASGTRPSGTGARRGARARRPPRRASAPATALPRRSRGCRGTEAG